MELALCLPLLAIAIAFLVEAGLVATDQVRVWHAAREAARVAAVTGEMETIVRAARGPGLDSASVVVEPASSSRTQGGAVTAGVSLRHDVRIPWLGEVLDVVLEGTATMRIETP